ncbi:MAG: hypothetical protein KTR32_37420 [Granulosicoccus sp.]|nr:hypothetical protein [Granulosicoccus sp.]
MSTPQISDQTIPTDLDSVFEAQSLTSWMKALQSSLPDGQSIDDLTAYTLDGIPISTLYHSSTALGPIDVPKSPLLWDNRLSVSDGDPAMSNQKALAGLKGGISSLEIHTRAPEQLLQIIKDVDLRIAPLSIRAGLKYQQSATELEQIAQSQSLSLSECAISFNADPIGHMLVCGGADVSIEAALVEMAEFCLSVTQRFDKCQAVVIDATVHHNAGASPMQELHAAIATATLYLEHMLNAGVDRSIAHQLIGFQIALDADVLIGVAKIRALKVLWQHVLAQFCNIRGSDTSVHIVAETSLRYMSSLDPWNNHLRNLIACTAAAQAGSDAIIVHPHSTADSDLADRLARNLPIIIEQEAGLRKVHDPFAGSHAMENLTGEFVQRTWHSLSGIDTCQQWLDEIQTGRWQDAVQATHSKRCEYLKNDQRIMVGVNRYQPAQSVLNGISVKAREHKDSNHQHPLQAMCAVRDASEQENAVDMKNTAKQPS